METVVKEVVVLTLALLTSLSQWFSEGTVAFQKEAYEPAVVAFSKVIDTEVAENPLYDSALYWRAQCYGKLERKEAAVGDLEALIRKSPGGPFGPLATADYKALTGKAWGGVDLSSPEKTWHSFVRAINKRDADGVIQCCGGKFKQQFAQMVLAQEDFWEEMSDEIPRLTYLSTRLNEKKNAAIINLAKQGRDRGEQLRVELVAGQWLLTDESRGAARDGFVEEAPSAQSKQHADINKLRQWDSAMEQCTLANGRRPTSLTEPAAYVKNPEEAKRSAVDGKPFVFAVPRDAQAQPWVFTATVTGGQRVALVNGSVRALDDAEFVALAKQYGVKVPGAWKKVEVSAATEEEVAVLILELGARTFKVRQEAYDKLKAMGPAAGKLLEKALQHDDMEIALQAKRLLSEI